MKIDENTQVMARLHPLANNRGLNIYNPYFEAVNLNALYILFYDSNLRKLIQGMRDFNMAGAIPAGFEKDPLLPELLDEMDPIAKKAGKVSVIRQREGKLIGYYQGGPGLAESIFRMTPVEDKKVVIMGAGNVVKGLLASFELTGHNPKEIEVYNRNTVNAEAVAAQFDSIKKVGSLKDMEKVQGDIFVNATTIGAPWGTGDDYVFTESFIDGFKWVADVAFVPLKPQLIQIAEQLGKTTSPGWKMFLYQAAICLDRVLDHRADEKVLAEKIVADFEHNWS